jgi:hypothetical protein
MPRIGTGCKLGRREPAEAGVRLIGIVVDSSGFDDLADLLQVSERVLIRTFVAQPLVE